MSRAAAEIDLRRPRAAVGAMIAAGWRSLFPAQRFLRERDGVALPPAELRAAGKIFKRDRTFRRFAIADVRAMERHTPLAGKDVLDFGCGAGRLYFGLRQRNEPASCLGVDVRRDVVDWAQRHISAGNDRFSFVQSDVHNERYNPDGALANNAWASSLNRAFDVIYCYSVLSHLTEADAAAVLALFASVARPGAFVFLTAFVADQREDIALNPQDAGIAIRGPLHVVRYRRDYFRNEMLRDFAIANEYQALATDGQSFFVLRPR